MNDRDFQNIIGGSLLFTFGIAFTWYAAEHYQLGTLRRMGAGMFPMGLGIILSCLSLFILVPALFRPGIRVRIPVRSPFFVLAGIAAFAIIVLPFGMIPAICALTLIAGRADESLTFPIQIGLCVALNLIVWVVFVLALSVPVPLLKWPI